MLDFFKEMSAEYFNKVLGDLREKNGEYVDTLKTQAKLGEQLFDLFDGEGEITLTAEQHETVKQYMDTVAHADLLAWDELYLQGYRDCIELLRLIRII
jgi:hypothetical protein